MVQQQGLPTRWKTMGSGLVNRWSLCYTRTNPLAITGAIPGTEHICGTKRVSEAIQGAEHISSAVSEAFPRAE